MKEFIEEWFSELLFFGILIGIVIGFFLGLLAGYLLIGGGDLWKQKNKKNAAE